MKKAVLAVLIAGMAVLTACSNNNTVKKDDNVYKYSDYEYKDEAQFYMKKNAAAAEKGYYYLSNSPVSGENYKFMYYYDMINNNSVALCSKVDCAHDDAECEAYLSDYERLGSAVWYYDGRIYMIEKTKEKDILVSYDKTLRDKKTEKTLSIDGMVACVGTANMDIRSFGLNFEVNATIYSERTVQRLERAFENDMTKSTQVTRKIYEERNLLIRFKEQFSRLLSPLL